MCTNNHLHCNANVAELEVFRLQVVKYNRKCERLNNNQGNRNTFEDALSREHLMMEKEISLPQLVNKIV